MNYLSMIWTFIQGFLTKVNAPTNKLVFAVLSTLLILAIFTISPAQVPVLVYKLGLVTVAAILGYWIAYMCLPKYRENVTELSQIVQAAVLLFRALVMLGTILAVALAL